MTIPMVIRLKNLFAMSEATRKAAADFVEAEYKRCSREGVPMVVGPNTEIAWPVERREHHFEVMGSIQSIREATKELEGDGWQACGVAPSHGAERLLVFKRPAREDGE